MFSILTFRDMFFVNQNYDYNISCSCFTVVLYLVLCRLSASMDGGGLPLEDIRRQQHRDDRLWRRELERATLYNLKRVHCPCCRCKGRVQCSLAKVKDHLINNGREPAFRVWRGPGARDSSDDEWEQELRRPARPHDGQFDAGLDMHGMVEDTF